jgi:hypothetical protein
MEKPFSIIFSSGSTAHAIRANTSSSLVDSLNALGLQSPCPVLVLVGGANGLRNYHIARLHSLFVKVLVPIAQSLNAVVIDGGTDAGIMQMMGQARFQTKATFPLIGVLPEGLATLPNQPPPHPDAAPLEPHHTHFILTPEVQPGVQAQWGDESAWIAEIANAVAGTAPSVAVLINGGEVTWQDAWQNVQVGRIVIAINGTGRTANTLAAAVHGTVTDERAVPILATGLLQTIQLEQLDDLAQTIGEILSTGTESWQEKIHTASF